jgi:hypothetical protein
LSSKETAKATASPKSDSGSESRGNKPLTWLVRTSHSERMLRALRNEIVESMAGKAYLISTSSIIGESDLADLYNAAPDTSWAPAVRRRSGRHLRAVRKP